MAEPTLKKSKSSNFDFDKVALGLFKGCLEKERLSLYAISDPAQLFDDEGSVLALAKEESLSNLFLDFCRIEDKIFFTYKIELDDVRASQELVDFCNETQTISLFAKSEDTAIEV